MNFIVELEATYRQNAAPGMAISMQKYMKDKFHFFGLQKEMRLQLLKPIWKKHDKEVSENFRDIVLQLFDMPQRELHYVAMLVLQEEIKGNYAQNDKDLIERLIVAKSWWDTVDFLAKNILGTYLRQYPQQIPEVVKTFSLSDNMWLNRAAILFQLGYKDNTDQSILFSQCKKHSGSKEFFIQKAIGWALREYAKIRPEAVVEFVNDSNLKPLSQREALKNL